MALPPSILHSKGCPLALDARDRSDLCSRLVPILGEHGANVLMSQFPASEADELVTKQFLRAELALTRGDLRGEMAEMRTELRGDMADLRTDMAERFHHQTVWLGSAMATATGVLAALVTLT